MNASIPRRALQEGGKVYIIGFYAQQMGNTSVFRMIYLISSYGLNLMK